MLHFIVLGIIPGTKIQLSFSDIVLILGTSYLVASNISRYLMNKLRGTQSRTVLNQLAI